MFIDTYLLFHVVIGPHIAVSSCVMCTVAVVRAVLELPCLHLIAARWLFPYRATTLWIMLPAEVTRQWALNMFLIVGPF